VASRAQSFQGVAEASWRRDHQLSRPSAALTSKRCRLEAFFIHLFIHSRIYITSIHEKYSRLLRSAYDENNGT